MEMPATPCGNDRLERTIVGLNLLEPVMNYDPSGIASTTSLEGVPPWGTLTASLLNSMTYAELSLQNRHSKVVTAKIVFLKGLSV